MASVKAVRIERVPLYGVRVNKHQIKSERTRLAILDAAEPLFAPYGLVGVSMRQIAAAAGVDLSLAAYHFESKLALYNVVIDRIMAEFTARRTALMDELERRNPAPTAVDLFDMLITAWFELRFGAAPHRARLLLHGHQPRDEEGSKHPSDPFVLRFLAALARAEPDRPAAYIHWAYHCWTGAMVFIMTSPGRIERLSGALCDVHSPEAVRAALQQQIRSVFPSRPPIKDKRGAKD